MTTSLMMVLAETPEFVDSADYCSQENLSRMLTHLSALVQVYGRLWVFFHEDLVYFGFDRANRNGTRFTYVVTEPVWEECVAGVNVAREEDVIAAQWMPPRWEITVNRPRLPSRLNWRDFGF